MGHGDYAICEFATRLASIEEKFSNDLRSIIECFYQSRLDLPAKKLDHIGKTRAKAAKNLKKIDEKKSDGINLWKICNIYSSCAVDMDNAMRDVRKSLRKVLVKQEKDQEREFHLKVNGNVITPMRRLGDDYRPTAAPRPSKMTRSDSKESQSGHSARIPIVPKVYAPAGTIIVAESPSEDYDTNKPCERERQRYLELWYKSVAKSDQNGKEASGTQSLKLSLKHKFKSSLDLLRPPVENNQKQRSDPTVKHSKSEAPTERRLQKENDFRKSKREKFLEKRMSLKEFTAPTAQIRAGPQIFHPDSLPPKPMLKAKYVEEGGMANIDIQGDTSTSMKQTRLEEDKKVQTIVPPCGKQIEDDDMLIMKL